jgi:hypothetical protein
MVHPPYSPDPVRSECHLFGPLKQALRGHQFIADQEVNDCACVAHRCSENILSDGMKRLVQQLTKCVEKQRDYVEK